MVPQPHLIAIAKSVSDTAPPLEAQDARPVSSIQEVGDASASKPKKTRVSKKVLSILIVVCIIGASGALVWTLYLRHWTVSDLVDQVINDPTPESPGFKHSLAGRTVTVEGTLTNIRSMTTNQGTLNILQLDDNPYIELLSWGGSFEIGQKIGMDVRFEWSECNLERHVYSPQIGFPALQYLLAMEVVMDSISYVGSNAVVSWDDVGPDVKIQIRWIGEPVSLAEANASLTAGRHSWTGEYVDTLGWYQNSEPQDSMTVLTAGLSSGGSIRFTDTNEDGYLDDQDCFVISNLARPTMDSAVKTYLFRCQWPRDHETTALAQGLSFFVYLIMTSKGVVCLDYSGHQSTPITPQCQLLTSIEGEGRRFTVAHMFGEEPIPWSQVKISFSDGNQFESTSLGTGDLSGAGPTTKTYPDFLLGGTLVTLTVTDESGNDEVDKGDFFVIRPSQGSFRLNTTYLTDLIYGPTAERAAWTQFRVGAQPRSNLSVTSTAYDARLEFVEQTYNRTLDYYSNTEYTPMDVSWDEVVVRLSDGSNSTLWSPPPDARDIGLPAGFLRTLGNLTVGCVHGDLQGNGFVNRGDYLVVTIFSGGGFSPSSSYSLTVEYAVTGEPICEASFSG